MKTFDAQHVLKNCKSCKLESGTLTSSNCFDGFYENPEIHNCDACKYTCSTCSSSSSCLSCADNHLLEGNSFNTLCSSLCITCYDEYIPSSTTCVKCSKGCKTCENVDNYIICLNCLDGYYKNEEKCKKCLSPCSTCFSDNMYRCFTCITGYYMDTIYTSPVPYGGQCKECNSKLAHCSECSTQCIDDDLDSYESCGNFKCSKCDGGFYLTSENGEQKCSSCPENCYKCTDSTTCKEYNSGYILNGTVCEPLDFCSNGHCEFENVNATYYQNITISPELIPSFDNVNNTESGGAVRLINAGLTCINVSFTGCKSQKAGGGIYIYNNIETEDETVKYSISFTGLTFENCEANYGAAVFIYSPSETSPVQLTSCTFKGNKLSSSSTSGKFYGGSALYIVSKNAEIIDCSFSKNRGKGGAVKISDDFSVVPDGLRILQKMLNYSQGSVLISGCLFEIDEESDSSLFYDNEKRLSKIEIKDCSFKGKLANKAHHIDGISNEYDEKTNIVINSCLFNSDQNGALNNKFIKIDLRNQVLFNSKYVKKQLNSKLMISVSSLAAVLVIVITIIIKKHNNNADENDNQESIEA